MTKLQQALLPSGLKDLLPPEAEEELRITNKLISGFSSFGYSLVKPPIAEFEDSLLSSKAGKALAHKIFRLMDPISQRMMGVRTDTTAQIARIANSSLQNEARPLRLSYVSDVLRVNGSQLRPERQFCQVGCELIGVSQYQDDVEICLLAIKSLNDCGLEDLSIDLTLPYIVDIIFDAFNVNADDRAELEAVIQKRDRNYLVEKNNDISKCLISLLDCSGVAETQIEKLKSVELPKAAQEHLGNLFSVYHALKDALKSYGLDSVALSIDLIERRGFEYKKGVSFTLFSPNVRGELGRGGRYDIAYDDNVEEATGFSLYMDSVIQAASIEDTSKNILVSDNESWEAIQELQNQGWNVSRGGKKESHTHEFVNGKITEIKN